MGNTVMFGKSIDMGKSLDLSATQHMSKLKKTVEESVLITHLNQAMEELNDEYFTLTYIQRQLHL